MIQYNTSFINNQGIIGILRRACNHVDKRLMDHGIRVAYIASRLMRGVPGLDASELRNICFLAALHDMGAYKTEEIDRLVQFETENIWEHSVYGYLFVKYFSPLSYLAPAVLYHHTPWSALSNNNRVSPKVKQIAQLISISDRLDIWMNSEGRPYEGFIQNISRVRDIRFKASLVDAMANLSFTPFTAEEADQDPSFLQMQSEIPFTHEEILSYLHMIINSIDFRSRHTVTHTITTTSISNELAILAKLSPEEQNQIVCGALMHDLGKIGIPVEILEHPGKLSPQAMSIMRTHVDITEEILGRDIPKPIRRIALRHHEKLNGSGYPRGLSGDELAIGERIVSLADIVSALAGTRSYKESFGKDRIVRIISEMRQDGLIDPDLVECMILHFDEIMEKTKERCQPMLDIFYKLQSEFTEIHARCLEEER